MRKENLERLLDSVYELEGLIHLAINRDDEPAMLPELIRRKSRELLDHAVLATIMNRDESEQPRRHEQMHTGHMETATVTEETATVATEETVTEAPAPVEAREEQPSVVEKRVTPNVAEEEKPDDVWPDEPEEPAEPAPVADVPEVPEQKTERMAELPDAESGISESRQKISDLKESLSVFREEIHAGRDVAPEPKREKETYRFDDYSEPRGRLVFSINDRYRFRRELFNGSDVDFNTTLSLVASMDDYEEAQDYFLDELQWDGKSQDVIDFLEILKNYFK